jgi:hypothetical protein
MNYFFHFSLLPVSPVMSKFNHTLLLRNAGAGREPREIFYYQKSRGFLMVSPSVRSCNRTFSVSAFFKYSRILLLFRQLRTQRTPLSPLPAPRVYEWNRECRVWFHVCRSRFHKTFDTSVSSDDIVVECCFTHRCKYSFCTSGISC